MRCPRLERLQPADFLGQAEFLGRACEVGAPGKLSREDAWLGRRRAAPLSQVTDRLCVAERGAPGWTEHQGSFAYEFTRPAPKCWAGVVQQDLVHVINAMRDLVLAAFC